MILTYSAWARVTAPPSRIATAISQRFMGAYLFERIRMGQGLRTTDRSILPRRKARDNNIFPVPDGFLARRPGRPLERGSRGVGFGEPCRLSVGEFGPP